MSVQIPESLDGDPRMIVGRRLRRRLDAYRIDLHQDTFRDVLAVVEAALAVLRNGDARDYAPHAALERGEEYFRIDLADLPVRPATGNEAQESASLVSILADPDGLPKVDAAGLDAIRPLLFYGIVMTGSEGEPITFLKKTDPVRVARTGSVLFRWGNALRRIETPDFAIVDDIDMVATAHALYVMSKKPFEAMLNDVRVVTQDVPMNVQAVRGKLSAGMPLSEGAADALSTLGSRKPTVANRIRLLSDRLTAVTFTADRLRAALADHGEDPSTLLDGDMLVFDERSAPLFLDLVEGRLFSDEFTAAPMRADRMSPRRRPPAAAGG